MKAICVVLLLAPLVMMLGCGDSPDLSGTRQATEAKVSADKGEGCAAECAAACADAAKAACASACAHAAGQPCGSGAADAFPHETLLTDFAGCCESTGATDKSAACCGSIVPASATHASCCMTAQAAGTEKAQCCGKCTCAPGACARAEGGKCCAAACACGAAEGTPCPNADKCNKSCPKRGKQT